MKFIVTVENGGTVIESTETDCILGALHEEGENYSAHLYADCDAVVVARAIRAVMNRIEELLRQPDIVEALQQDGTDIYDLLPKDGRLN